MCRHCACVTRIEDRQAYVNEQIVSVSVSQVPSEGELAALPVEMVPIDQLLLDDSPRQSVVVHEHIRAMAEHGNELPPILVHRPTMRIIDGAHRVHVARRLDQRLIAARFFSGAERDCFVLAVRSNIAHGLPLSLAERLAAADRIIRTHPHLSDRAIGRVTGLAHQTVGQARRRATGDADHLNTRIGLDNRVRPLDAATGRRRAASLLTSDPTASLRAIARSAGISPGTVRDVRARISRGEDPAPSGVAQQPGRALVDERPPTPQDELERSAGERIVRLLRVLRKDPRLRFTESGRLLLRLLGTTGNLVAAPDSMTQTIPEHCRSAVADIATECADAWSRFAEQVGRGDDRAES